MKVIGANDFWRSYESIDNQEKGVISEISLKIKIGSFLRFSFKLPIFWWIYIINTKP